MLTACIDTKGLLKAINEDLLRVWQASTGFDAHAGDKLKELDRKIANIRQAIANGLDDIAWANEQIRAMKAQRDELKSTTVTIGEAPHIDSTEALAYMKRVEHILTDGSTTARRKLIRECVESVQLQPDTLEMIADYLLPTPIIRIGSGNLAETGAYRDRCGSGGGILGIGERVFPISTLTPCVNIFFSRPPKCSFFPAKVAYT